MLTFTGSGPVGRMLMKYAADSNLKRVSLELGGKSPHIIFADCPDLDAAAQHAAFGIFYNQGEVCTAGSRLLVDEIVRRRLPRQARRGREDAMCPAIRWHPRPTSAPWSPKPR